MDNLLSAVYTTGGRPATMMKLSPIKSKNIRMIRAFMAEDRIYVNQVYADLCRHIRVRRSDRRGTRIRKNYRNILEAKYNSNTNNRRRI